MTSLQGKTVLVIGANGAFGVEFCRQLELAGAKVIGTARTAESSSRLSPSLFQRLLLDLAEEASIQTLANYLNAVETQIDGMIFAAGLVAFGAIEETPAPITAELMQVNALGQIDLAARLLPKLKASASQGREPFIVSISGVISETPMPKLASYSASKTALHGFAKAATKELSKAGIRWLDARPGHTESGLANRAIFGQAPNFGTGASVNAVVSRIMLGITQDEADLASTAFK